MSADAPAHGQKSVTSVLFVCMGNLCRSPIAEAIAHKQAAGRNLVNALRFASAGTRPPRAGAPADARALCIGQRRGYDLSRHRTRAVTQEDFLRFDLVLAMDRAVHSILSAIAPPDQLRRLGHFLSSLDDPDRIEVPDPYYGNLPGFEAVFDLCEAGVDAILRSFADNTL